MNTAIETTRLTVRKANMLDFGPIRKLPVQLCQHSVAALQLKQLRMMLQVGDHHMVVAAQDDQLTGFIALQQVNAFLLLKFLAVDRLARNLEVATQLERQATALASEINCAAVIVKADHLTQTSLSFFRGLGYHLDGHTLIKDLHA